MIRWVTAVCVLTFLRGGLCATPVFAADFVELTVVKHDRLISICEKYLQDPAQWREIGRINRLKNVNVIKPGQRLSLPIRLLKGVPVDGRVVFVRSEAQLKEPGEKNWKPLRRNDVIRQGSSIRTGGESAVEIVFDDGASLYQQPDTLLEVGVSQLKGETHIFQRLLLEAGRVVTKVRRAMGRDSRIEIRTPSATAVARGTEYRVSTGASGATTSEVLHGVIDVEAMRRSVAVREGEGTLVKKGQAPLPPRKLLAPPVLRDRQPVYRGAPITLAFSSIEGAVSHRLLLSRDQGGKDVVAERLFKAGESPALTSLEDGPYFVRVSSVDELGLEGASGPVEQIAVRNNPLPPFMQQPMDGASIKGTSVGFRWLKVGDAASYQLQIADDREFLRSAVKPLDVSGTSYKHAFPETGSKYFRIRSVASDGFTGLWSDTISFTLLPPPPAPEPEKPALDGNRIRIRWGNRGTGFTYRVQLSAEATFIQPLADRKVAQPEISLESPEMAGVYYVRISSIDPEGFEGPFSPPQTFEITRWWPYAAGGALGVAGVILLILL